MEAMEPNLKKSSLWRIMGRGLVCLALLAAGGGAWAYFRSTAPTVKRKPPQERVATVEVLPVSSGDFQAVVQAMGTVIPSRQITLKARVSGEVQAVSDPFVPGGRLAAGEEILRLDPADYEVRVQKAESALAKAKADLDIEKGSQAVAREELRLLKKTSGNKVKATDLALRKPQLQQAQAAVSSAEADLRMARLELERTVVRAPFNALVLERNVNVGSHVSSQDALAVLVDADEYWVEASVPLDRLPALELDAEKGSPALVHSPAGDEAWEGTAVRSTGRLADKSRMARVIVRVPHPLESPAASLPLMLDDYVSVEILGRTLTSVVELPRSALREGNTVWLYEDGVLEVRRVETAWKEENRVFVRTGLRAGSRVVVSDLAAPVHGMRLALAGEENGSGQVALVDREEEKE